MIDAATADGLAIATPVRSRASERPPSPEKVDAAPSESPHSNSNSNANGEAVHPGNIAIPKGSHVALTFPSFLERLLMPFDDALIPHAQALWASPLLRYAMLATTTLTAIETALPAPGILYALGYDAGAGLSTSVLFVVAIVSQIPKKFVWRRRPWMAGRAKPFRRDNTSSFPSRAVICGVVFSWLAFAVIAAESPGPLAMPSQVVLIAVALCASAASIARVACGAHYPSDCVCGFILGVLILRVGGGLELSWLSVGSAALASQSAHSSTLNGLSVSTSTLFSSLPVPALAASDLFTSPELAEAGAPSAALTTFVISSLAELAVHTPRIRLVACILVSYALTLGSIAGFWIKCSYVYGLLLSAATFRFVYLAPAMTGVTLAGGIVKVSVKERLGRAGIFALMLAFGMATRGKKGAFRMFSFTLIYFGSLIAMLWFRAT
jgi:membrane-associated phospholipid phosphatase